MNTNDSLLDTSLSCANFAPPLSRLDRIDVDPSSGAWTVAEGAHALGKSVRTVQKMLKSGALSGYMISGPRGPEWRMNPVMADSPAGMSIEEEDLDDVSRIAASDVKAIEDLNDCREKQLTELLDALDERIDGLASRMYGLEFQLCKIKAEQDTCSAHLGELIYRTQSLDAQVHNITESMRKQTQPQRWWHKLRTYFAI